ncbi:triose-phosphate isomerase, partial [Escherichia coli]|nr:triose-phosphate isomerase [Escherichia coli]
TKEERDAGRMWEKVSGQVRAVVEGLGEASGGQVVLAYEPIWAIGTGETASPEDAQDAIGRIRELLGELRGGEFASEARILY